MNCVREVVVRHKLRTGHNCDVRTVYEAQMRGTNRVWNVPAGRELSVGRGCRPLIAWKALLRGANYVRDATVLSS